MSQFWNGEVLAAPNLITVCVDESQASEISGRLYHGCSQEPQSFENVVQLIRYMADFYDSIRGTKRHLCHFPHLRQIPPERHLAGHLSMERRTSGDGILQCPGTDHRDGCHTGKKIKVQKKAGDFCNMVLTVLR